MAERDITLNITGRGMSEPTPTPVTPGGGGSAPANPNVTGSDNSIGPALSVVERLAPSIDTLISEIRNLIDARGDVAYGDKGWDKYSQGIANEVSDKQSRLIDDYYDTAREANVQRMSDRLSQLDEERQSRLTNYRYTPGTGWISPEGRQLLTGETPEKDAQRWYRTQESSIMSSAEQEDKRLSNQAEQEKSQLLRDTNAALKAVNETLRRESGDNKNDTYLGRLRLQRKELSDQVSEAKTDDEYFAAKRQLMDFDEQQAVLENRMLGRNLTNMRLASSGASMITSAASGSASGVGAAAAGLGAAALGIPIAGIIAGALIVAVGKLISDTSKRIESTAPLAAYRGLWGDRTGTEALYSATNAVINAGTQGVYGENVSRVQLGITDEEFIRKAVQIIATSGMTQDTEKRVFYTRANEIAYNLEEGSLIRASKYERYGTETANSAIIKLADQLEILNSEGVSTGIGGTLGYARMRERLEIQQMLMESYYSRYNRPDYNVANAVQVAYSSQMGDAVQDSRLGNAIQAIDAGIANGRGGQQMYTLLALQQSAIGRKLGFDKMNFQQLRWVQNNPQAFGLNEVELNTAVLQQLARNSGINPEEATWEEIFASPLMNQFLYETYGNLPVEQLKQLIPGLVTGNTQAKYRSSLADMTSRGGSIDSPNATARANRQQLQNVTDMAGLRTLAGEIQDKMGEWMTKVMASMGSIDENRVYKGDW
nr:MAG TPA: hypothetical protein [Caudoviricetes sp.]